MKNGSIIIAASLAFLSVFLFLFLGDYGSKSDDYGQLVSMSEPITEMSFSTYIIQNTQTQVYTDFQKVPSGVYGDDNEDVLIAVRMIRDRKGYNDGFIAVGNCGNRICIAKYQEDGTPDNGFGGYYHFGASVFDDVCPGAPGAFRSYASGQIKTVSFPSVGSFLRVFERAADAVVVNERIIFCGYWQTIINGINSNKDFLVGQIFLTSGRRDCHITNGFGNYGFVSVDFGNDSEATAMTIQNDDNGGLIIVGNVERNNSGNSVGIVKLHLDKTNQHMAGDLDTSFGNNGTPGGGKILLDFNWRFDDVTCSDVLNEEYTDSGNGSNIILTGSYSRSHEDEYTAYVARISSAGDVLDFFIGPVYRGVQFYPKVIKWTHYGQVIVAGERVGSGPYRGGFLMRFDLESGLDPTFARNGYLDEFKGPINDISVGYCGRISAVGIDSKGKFFNTWYSDTGRKIGDRTIHTIHDVQFAYDRNGGSIIEDDHRSIIGGINWRNKPTDPGDPNNDFTILIDP